MHLVLVELLVEQLGLALLLERNDDERHEDVHEEEGEHDEVDHVEERHARPVVRPRALVLLGALHRILEYTTSAPPKHPLH